MAPGGRFVVAGVAGPSERVSLYAGTGRLAVTTSGPGGGFRLLARAPAVGRYHLVLETAETRTPIGTLIVRPLILAAVGDVTFGARVRDAIRAFGRRYPWLDVAPVLREADIATANLEGAVSTRGTPVPGKEFTFRGPPSALRAAARFAGLDVVTLANNHTLDYGRVAFRDTIAYAREYGLATVGGAISPAHAARRSSRSADCGSRFSATRTSGRSASTQGRADRGPHRRFRSTSRRTWARPRDALMSRSSGSTGARSAISTPTLGSARWPASRSARARRSSSARTRTSSSRSSTGNRLLAWSLGNFVFGANTPGTERTGILRIRLGASGVLRWGLRRARIAGVYRVQPRLIRAA